MVLLRPLAHGAIQMQCVPPGALVYPGGKGAVSVAGCGSVYGRQWLREAEHCTNWYRHLGPCTLRDEAPEDRIPVCWTMSLNINISCYIIQPRRTAACDRLLQAGCRGATPVPPGNTETPSGAHCT